MTIGALLLLASGIAATVAVVVLYGNRFAPGRLLGRPNWFQGLVALAIAVALLAVLIVVLGLVPGD